MTYDSSAEADIRGIDINKLATGFADGVNKFKKFCAVSSTTAREIRWYKKAAGYITGTVTTEMTSNFMANTSFKARPQVAEQTWERQTSYVRKFFIESPSVTIEDINDCDPDVFGTLVKDLTLGVERQVDRHIINVLTESYTPALIQTQAAVATWATVATCNPILDILNCEGKLRAYNYSPEGAVLAMNSIEYKHFINFLISVKGSSIPAIAAEAARTGVVMEFLNKQIVVDENVTTAYAIMFIPQTSVAYKSFMPITSGIVEEVGISKKVRIWEEGVALLLNPKSVCLLTGTA